MLPLLLEEVPKTLMQRQNSLYSPKGFTLLELLLAVAILMLIVGIIGGALRLSVRSWEKGEDEVEEFRKTRIVLAKLAQQLKSFYPYWLQQEQRWSLAFDGQSQALTFVSPVSLLSPFITGLVCVQYGFEYDGISDQGKNLIAREFRVIDGESLKASLSGGALDGNPAVTLLTDLEDLTFDYYFVPEDAEEGQWVPSWVMEEQEDAAEITLPKAVRITLTQRPAHKKEYDEEAEPLITAVTIPLVTAPFQEVSLLQRKIGALTSAQQGTQAAPFDLLPRPSLPPSSLPPPPPGGGGGESAFEPLPGPPGGGSHFISPFTPSPGGGAGHDSSPFGR
jgi:type II secretory pathway component PulJ